MASTKVIDTVFNYTDKDVAYFSSTERRWINKMHKLARQHPDKVTILKEPEDNDDCIYVRLPVKALRVQIPKDNDMTEEEKQAFVNRLAGARAKKE